MCSVCAGSVCAGTGGCAVVINHAPEVIRIAHTSGMNLLSILQGIAVSFFTSSKQAVLTLIKR